LCPRGAKARILRWPHPYGNFAPVGERHVLVDILTVRGLNGLSGDSVSGVLARDAWARQFNLEPSRDGSF